MIGLGRSWRQGSTTERVCMLAWGLIGVLFVVSLFRTGAGDLETLFLLAIAMVIVLSLFASAKIARIRREGRSPQV